MLQMLKNRKVEEVISKKVTTEMESFKHDGEDPSKHDVLAIPKMFRCIIRKG